MLADNTARMHRFRTLPLRSRLAVLVQNAPQMFAAVQAAGTRDPKFEASLTRATAIGEQACLGRLSDADAREIDPLVKSIVAQQAKLSGGAPDADQHSTSPILDVLRESAHIGVRVLLAAKSLQADATGDASVQVDEGFHSLLEYLDEVVAVVAATQSADRQRRQLHSRFSYIDSQMEWLAEQDEVSRSGSSDFLSAEIWAQLRRIGRSGDGRHASDAWHGEPKPTPVETGSSGSPDFPKSKGLGIGALFVILALLKIVSRMDGCGPGHQQGRQPDQQQVREEPPPNHAAQLRDLHNLTVLQKMESTLTEAEEAIAAEQTEAASATLKKASADLASFKETDLANNNVARSFVRVAWMCGDLMRQSKTVDPLETYDVGVRAARGLANRTGEAEDRSLLAGLLNNKAYALHNQGQTSASLELLTEAVALQLTALEAEPTNEQFREFMSNQYDSLVEVHVALRQWQPAVDAALQERALWTTQSQPLYDVACRLAVLASVIRNCPEDVPERDRLVATVAGQSLDALRAARGSELNLADEIDRNKVLKILETVTQEDPQ